MIFMLSTRHSDQPLVILLQQEVLGSLFFIVPPFRKIIWRTYLRLKLGHGLALVNSDFSV
ncbi:hypothetical protein LguiB_026967 [Lonicera macranthoides]